MYIPIHSCSSLTVCLSLSLPQIWNSDTGEELVTCNIPSSGTINRLALSGDDQRLIVSKADGSVFVSNISNLYHSSSLLFSSLFLPPFSNPPSGRMKETEKVGKKEEMREGKRRGKGEGGKERGKERRKEEGKEGGRERFFLYPTLFPSIALFYTHSLPSFLSPSLPLFFCIPLSLSTSNSTSPPAPSSFLLTPSFPFTPYSNYYLSINFPLYNFILNQVCNTRTGELLFTSSQDKRPCFCSLNQTGSLAIVGYYGGVFKVCPSLFIL